MTGISITALGEEIHFLTDVPEILKRTAEVLFGVRDTREYVGEAEVPALVLARGAAAWAPKGEPRRLRLGEFGDFAVDIAPDGGRWLARVPADDRAAVRVVWHAAAAYVRRRLRERGFWFVHAGAVERGGSAAAFVGANDTGKTTLVTAFVKRGWNFLSDDNLPLRAGPPMAAVFNPEAVNASRLSVADLDGLVSRGWRPFGWPGFVSAPAPAAVAAPLKRIFFIERSEKPGVQALSSREGAVRLLGMSKTPLLSKSDYDEWLGAASDTARGADCFLLRFDPVKSAAETVRIIESVQER